MEYDIRGLVGSAVRNPEIHLLGRQVLDRVDVLSCEDMDLLIVELGDVLEIVLDAWKRRITLQCSEHIRLDNSEIDTPGEDDIGDVLKRAFANDEKRA